MNTYPTGTAVAEIKEEQSKRAYDKGTEDFIQFHVKLGSSLLTGFLFLTNWHLNI